MEETIRRRLIEINARFYQEFGRAFSATRQRVQPGIVRFLQRAPREGRWLDLGCGNGSLARHWLREGFRGEYWGVDFSPALLEEAHHSLPSNGLHFLQADLSSPDWDGCLPAGDFDGLVCFAALHHLPGAAFRRAWLGQAAKRLRRGGWLGLSVWQFQHSARLQARVLPWERAGLRPEDVEPGDCLLDWRFALAGQAEQVGLRYVHLFSAPELEELGHSAGLRLAETFESDGQGGRLGLYQVWRKE